MSDTEGAEEHGRSEPIDGAELLTELVELTGGIVIMRGQRCGTR